MSPQLPLTSSRLYDTFHYGHHLLFLLLSRPADHIDESHDVDERELSHNGFDSGLLHLTKLEGDPIGPGHGLPEEQGLVVNLADGGVCLNIAN
jgi:hypothetical protein